MFGKKERKQNLVKQIDLVEQQHLKLLNEYGELMKEFGRLRKEYGELMKEFAHLRFERAQLKKQIDNLMGAIQEEKDGH